MNSRQEAEKRAEKLNQGSPGPAGEQKKLADYRTWRCARQSANFLLCHSRIRLWHGVSNQADVILRQQRDFTDNSVRLKNLRHLRQLRLTKTDIHPLKSMGRCPAAMLPLWLYKSKLLTPKRKPASTFLQKAYILFKAINRKSTFCWKNAVHKLCTQSKEMFIYCLQPCCCRYNEIVMR